MEKYSKYFVTLAVALAAAFVIAWSKNIFSAEGQSAFYILSDACLIPGIIILGGGIITWVGNEGIFNGMKYGWGKLFRPNSAQDVDNADKKEKFFEYNSRKKSIQKPFGHLIAVGVVMVALSIIFAFV